MRCGDRYPFRQGGGLDLVSDPTVAAIDMIQYADMAYAFMTGIPGFGQRGFCMMDPETLNKQRITYVRYWMHKLTDDLNAAAAALRRT